MKKLLFILLACVFVAVSCSDDRITPEDEPETPVGGKDDDDGKEEEEKPAPLLRVEGRYLKDATGKIVNLHGFVQTYSPFFNNNAWNNYNVSGCLSYNKRMIDEILGAGWKMNFVRLHMDPYWSTTPGSQGRYEGHEYFEEARFRKYLDEVFVPMAEYAASKGLFVVMRPPGVCPEKIAVNDDYNEYLNLVWGIVSQHKAIKNNPRIMFELANEPIQIRGTDGVYGASGQACFDQLKLFFQSTVDIIRAHADNIIWVPGLGYQSQYAGFANNPVTGGNIGYAIHVYPGWFNSGQGYENFQRGWDEQVKPAADIAPIMVTEMDWAPEKYNSSWGKSFTGTVGDDGFGANFKYIVDNAGNVSWLLFTDCHKLAEFKNVPGTPGAYTFLNDPEACPWPVYHWFKEYAEGTTKNSKIASLAIQGADNGVEMLTGSDRYLIVKATFEDGTTELVTAKATFSSTAPTVIDVKGNGRVVALKDGTATVTATYQGPLGDSKQATVALTSTTFPFAEGVFNPSIWETGTFDFASRTLITGSYGFGGWKYTNGVNLSGYKYLIAELGNDNQCQAQLRLFDENNYWSPAAEYPFGSSRRVVVELDKMYKSKDGTQVKLNASHIYILGFWSHGGKPIVISRVYLTDTQ